MNIRKYRSGDEEELWQLCRNTTHRINGRDYTAAQVEKWAPRDVDMQKWTERLRETAPFVLERDGSILGFAELGPDGRISAFYCHYQWQRRGVGTALYQRLESEAIRSGVGRVHVESSVSAKPFFLRMGFEVVDEHEFVDCGAPVRNHIMRKRLSR